MVENLETDFHLPKLMAEVRLIDPREHIYLLILL